MEKEKERLLESEKGMLASQINNHIIFEIDKENDPLEYKNERARFLNLLSEYCAAYLTADEFKACGYEVMLAASKTLASYKKENGEYTSYFWSVFGKDMKIAHAKEKVSNVRSGISVDANTDRLLRLLLEFIRSREETYPSEEVLREFAVLNNIKIEKARRLLEVKENTVVIKETSDQNEDNISIFDKISSESQNADYRMNFDILANQYLDICESEYNSLQNRVTQKTIISVALTRHIVETLIKCDIEQNEWKKYLAGKTFFNIPTMQYFARHNTLPTNRQICKFIDNMQKSGEQTINEASISRTINKFFGKVLDRVRANGINY